MDGGQIFTIVLTAVVTLAATVIGQRLLEKRAELRYRIRSSGDLVPLNAKVPLDIRYADQRVRSLVLLQVDFINTGNVPLQRTVHAVKIEWNVPSGTLIQESADDKKIVMMGYVDNDGVEQRAAMIELLNDDETSTMDFLVADETEPTITIEARGIGVVGKLETPNRLRPYAPTIGIFLGFVVASAVGAALLPLTEALIKTYGFIAIGTYALFFSLLFGLCIGGAIVFFDRRR